MRKQTLDVFKKNYVHLEKHDLRGCDSWRREQPVEATDIGSLT
ncbi:protein of unknown function [Nitrospira japonica]|uniref:Uncharacterized protein n=1 Tax=Nitrospira japonica TaxID=1325564 RepID=A0A1W1IA98_9BACT|nr:protein of unknown function [Nitrospira japonica]